MFRGLIILVLGLLLSGCAALTPASSVLGPLQGGSTPLQVHEQTSVNLSQDNFVLVKTNVFGMSKGFSLLGIITIYPASFTKAMDRMYGSAQMRPGTAQTLAHLIVQHSGSYWILFGIPRVEVHADIVEFRPVVATSERVKPKRARSKPPDNK